MATEKRLSDSSYVAGEDLSSYQYYIVGINSSNQAILADGDETLIQGVLQNKPTSGQAAEVRKDTGSISKVKYGGNVTVGAALTASSGLAIVTTTAGARIIGHARVAGVINDIGSVDIEPGYYPNAG